MESYEKKYYEAQEWIESIYSELSHEQQMEAEAFFPELKENEDEKIRKAMIKGLSSCASKYWGGFEIKAAIAWLEKQGEQKPIDKVEPKFKVGNWYQCTKDFFGKGVTFDKNTAYYCAKEGCLQDEYGCHIAIVKDLYDNFKLWTIQDAKEGDVLDANGAPFIYKKHDKDYVYFYCGVNLVGEFIEANGIDTWNSNNKVYPATKEQRDALMKAMADAGWEFDFEKKELKKVEQKPTNKNLTDVGHDYYSELLSNDDSDNIDEYAYQCAYCMSHDWMKETATWEDVQKAVKLGAEWQKSKPSWSEEDEDAIGMAIIALEDMYDEDAPNTTYGGYNLPFNKAAERLKSLKDRVQPKQEWNKGDMEMLNAAISFVEKSTFTTIGKGKNNTVAWLKSLKSRVIPQSKQEWSKEDETKMHTALAFIKSEFPKEGNEEIMEDTIEWLKSLKPQKQWKPSKGQLECLGYAIDKAEKDYSPLANNRIYLTLKALKKELEKLTE